MSSSPNARVGIVVFSCFITLAPSVSLAEDLETVAAQLTARVRETKGVERSELVGQLARLGPEARSAIPVLEKLVVEGVPSLDLSVIGSITALKAMGGEGVPALRRLLNHENQAVRKEVLSELASFPCVESFALHAELMEIAERDRIRPSDHAIQKEIQATPRPTNLEPSEDWAPGEFNSPLFRDYRERAELSALAVDALIGSGENRDGVLKYLLKRLDRADNPSARGLTAFPEAQAALPRLRALARGATDPQTRIDAARALAEMDPSGKIALPILMLQFGDHAIARPPKQTFADPESVSQAAVQTFRAHRARRIADPVKLLLAIKQLKKEDPIRQWHLLADCGATNAIGMLRREFKQPLNNDERRRAIAAAALIKLDPDANEPVDYLLKIMNDESKPTHPVGSGMFYYSKPAPLRALAARALGFVSPVHRKRVMPSLREAMKTTRGRDEKPGGQLATWASWSVVRLDPMDREAIAFLLKPANPSFFSFDREKLQHVLYPETPESVVASLGNRFDLAEPRLLARAFVPFVRDILLAAKPPRVEPLVAKAFRDLTGDPRDDAFLIEVLLNLNTSRQLTPAFETICKQCQSPKYEARKIAVHLLGELQLEPLTSIPILTQATKDPRALVRARAAKALAKFGAQAASAVPRLRTLQDDNYHSVRDAAKSAIRQTAAED